MNPYVKTAEEMKRQSEGPKRFAKSAIGIGTAALGASSFTPILSRVAPFLSQYIPEDLAIKGLSKISPKFGSFIDTALNNGYDFSEIKKFIGDQIDDSKKPQENRSIIEQYSPELFNFIKEQVGKGRNALEAGAIAQNNDKFKSVIKKLESDHKTNWSNILQSVFGGGQSAQPEEQQSPQGQQQAQGGIDPNLQAIGQKLQQLLQSRGM